ncbi:MAG: Flagellar hook-basal body complex protein FliE [Phycisphaerae bacterium]|nr:Flagellar hook-basal body complex protein FliE [Phycisphaerae bacterium]
MTQPIGPMNIPALNQPGSISPAALPGLPSAGGPSFQETLLNSLEEVNKLQQEAAHGVERLATGQTDNMAEVFTTVRKAEVAFSMLMEIRNKLIDAYREIQQIRV